MQKLDNANREVWVENGQLRAALKGFLDVAGLSRDLREKGYFLANDPEEIDSQGWGKDFDAEGYYPHRVFRDGENWIFATTPEDFRIPVDSDQFYQIAAPDREEMRQWVEYLEKWCS